MKYKIFTDSVAYQIKKNSFKIIKEFILNLNESFKVEDISKIDENILSKYNSIPITFNQYYKRNLDFITDKDTNEILCSVYALKNSIKVEVHGISQYVKPENRKKKELILHKIYTHFYKNLTITRLDVAIDFNAKFEDITIVSSSKKRLPGKKKDNCVHRFYDGNVNAKTRLHGLKIYYKSNQQGIGFHLGEDITRAELILKRTALQPNRKYENLSEIIIAYFRRYRLLYKRREFKVNPLAVADLMEDFESILSRGKHTKKYSNYYRNVEIMAANSKISWQCFINKISKTSFANETSEISLTTLKKYHRYYARLPQENIKKVRNRPTRKKSVAKKYN